MQRAATCRACFTASRAPPSRQRVVRSLAGAKSGGGSGGEEPKPGLGLKAVWMGAEAFGNVMGASKAQQQQQAAGSQPTAVSRAEAIAAIRDDYAKDYFVTGVGEMAAYDPDCYFADPFAGFSGTQRFKRNVNNLGAYLQDIRLDIVGFEEREQEVWAKWRFSATLDLPWKPILAAAGSTTHVFDPDTGLVVKHVEAWDVEPARVVKQLLKPSAKVPATQWEVLMSSVHDGDVVGIWFALSSKVATLALPASALMVVLHLARGEGLGALEAATYISLVTAVATEGYKVVNAFMGGESG